MKTKQIPARKKKQPTTVPEASKFVLRIPPKLHKKIKREAADNFQSMNEFINRAMALHISPKNQLADLIRRLEEKGVI